MVALTIFSCLRGWGDDRIAMLQENAVRSWLALTPRPEILLFCDDPDGTADRFGGDGVQVLPQVKRNEWGTPLVSELWRAAEKRADGGILCYANADIVITQAWLDALNVIDLPEFLAVCKRGEWMNPRAIDFNECGWHEKINDEVKREGRVALGVAADIFAFTPNIYGAIPPFAIGRFAFDNWLINEPLRNGLPVVKLPDMAIIHQRHSINANIDEQECEINRKLAGLHFATIDQATREVKNGALQYHAFEPYRRDWYVPKAHVPDEMKETITVGKKQYPAYLNRGNAAQFIVHEAHRWCIGKGLDIGAGKWPLEFTHGKAEPVDFDRQISDAKFLPGVEESSQDFIFSSHCLEHIADWISAIGRWRNVLRPGGVLFLYLPHPQFEPWQPNGAWVSGHMWSPSCAMLVGYLQRIGMEVLEYNEGPDIYQSFHVVARKPVCELNSIKGARRNTFSIIVALRDDDHGGKFLERVQLFTDNLFRQVKQFGIEGELIFVDWNSPTKPTEKQSWAQRIKWKTPVKGFDVRVISVPPRIHNTLAGSDSLQFFQMIAKNVGAVRARGDYILFTNPDILLEDKLIEQFTRIEFSERAYYRAVRHDLDMTPSPADLTALSRFGDEHVTIAHFGCNQQGSFAPAFTNACGDFTLLHRELYDQLRGYPEVAMFSLHLDSVLCKQAYDMGVREEILTGRAFHMPHHSGLGDKRFKSNRDLVNYWTACRYVILDSPEKVVELLRQKNNQGWGLRHTPLPEYKLNEKTLKIQREYIHPQSPKKIAFILTGGLGDVLEGTPTAYALQAKFKDARITWVVDEAYADIIMHDFDRCVLSGVKIRDANSLEKIRLWIDRFGSDYDIIFWPMGIANHSPRTRYRNHMMDLIAAWCDVELQDRMVRAPETQNISLRELAIPAEFVAVCISPCYSCRDWNPDQRRSIIAKLLDEGHSVVLIGGGDGANYSALCNDRKKLINLNGALTPLQTLDVIRHARLYIGPDTGPSWLACAAHVTPKLCFVDPDRCQLPVGFEQYTAGVIRDIYYTDDMDRIWQVVNDLLRSKKVPAHLRSAPPKPIITVGLIVLNGATWLPAWYKTYRHFADQIVVVEGADAEYFARINPNLRNQLITPDGHSTDETLSLLNEYADEGTVDFTIITTNRPWESKNRMTLELSKHVEGNYLFEIDADEFYFQKHLRQIRQILCDNPYVGTWRIRPINFWKSGHYHTVPQLGQSCWWGDAPVLFKWSKGAQLFHRPRHVEPRFGHLEEYLPVPLHHFNYVREIDAQYKTQYHRHPMENNQNWFEDVWKRWSPNNRIDLERGIQVYGRAKTEVCEYTGPHPRYIKPVLKQFEAQAD